VTVIEAIKTRRSVAKLRPDPVPREVIEQMLEAAVWAPNHRMTEPWRFYVLIDDQAKRRFAEIRRRFRATTFPDPAAPEAVRALDKLTADTLATPALIIVTAHTPDDEEVRFDNIAATFMGIQNMMLTATSQGVGTYMRTGGLIHDPELRVFLGVEPDRRILAVLYVGYPVDLPQRRRVPASERTVWM
jgi:nitroreductase